jgi:hypothetical protein
MSPEPNALIAIGSDPRLGPLLGALLRALDAVADYELTPRPDAISVADGGVFLEIRAQGPALLLRFVKPGRDGVAPIAAGWEERPLADAGDITDGLLEALAAACVAVAPPDAGPLEW